jgi:hypothetical protein
LDVRRGEGGGRAHQAQASEERREEEFHEQKENRAVADSRAARTGGFVLRICHRDA